MYKNHLSKQSVKSKVLYMFIGAAIAMFVSFSIVLVSQANAKAPIESNVTETIHWNFVSSPQNIFTNIPWISTDEPPAELTIYGGNNSTPHTWDRIGNNTGLELSQNSTNEKHSLYLPAIDKRAINSINISGDCTTIGPAPTNLVICNSFEDAENRYVVEWPNATQSISITVLKSELINSGINLSQPIRIGFDRGKSVWSNQYAIVKTLEVEYGPIEKTISGMVVDEFGVPIAGAFAEYCSWTPWGEIPIFGKSAFSDIFGFYTITGITEEMLPGVVRVYKDGYDTVTSSPIWFVPDDVETIYRFIQITSKDHLQFAKFIAKGLENHLTFDMYIDTFKDGEQIGSHEETFDKVDSFIPVGATYNVRENGNLNILFSFEYDGHKYQVETAIKAIGEEGFVVDKWNVNGQDLLIGQTYTQTGTEDVNAFVSYKTAEQPVPPTPPEPVPPQPGPTPVDPDNPGGGGTASTGDSMPLVPVAALAVIAAWGFVINACMKRRKFHK